MKGLAVKLATKDAEATMPRLRLLQTNLKDRIGINEAISRRALNLTRDHLIQIAAERHDTAKRLGASPTGHWAQAAEKTTGAHTRNGVTLTVNQPGISRAGGDVTIRPGSGKKFLTIPQTAKAYGRRAYRVPNLFVYVGKMGGLYLARKNRKGDKLSIWYALVRSVKQKQDRTLLPSDAEYSLTILQGVDDFVAYLLTRQSPGAQPSTT